MMQGRSVGLVTIVGMALAGCTVMGNGHNTVILGELPKASSYPGGEFQGLIHDGSRPPILPGSGTAEEQSILWAAYRASHPNSAASVALDLTVRDLNVTPSLDQLNIETTNASDVAKIISDTTIAPDLRGQLVERLRNNYRRMPENYLPMVPRQDFITFPGDTKPRQVTVYHWFPKVALDLTGVLQTVGSLDRFDFLAVAVTLQNEHPNITFANYAPKAADLFDFSLGSLKQSASATGEASIGGSASTKTIGTSPAFGPATGSEINTGSTNGAGLNLTISDELTRDLKASLDTRSAGIINDGRTFIIQLRGNDQRRISGTYSYTVMLDIAPEVKLVPVEKPIAIVSESPVKEVFGDVRIIGVIRHVRKRGKTGTFKRVPEPTNDQVFDEVLIRQKRVLLWRLHQDALIDPITQPTNLTVYTNHDNAAFSVIATDGSRRIVARGRGRESNLVVAGIKEVAIEYDPIILGGDGPVVLTAAPARQVALGDTPTKLIGVYLPRPSAEKKHAK